MEECLGSVRIMFVSVCVWGGGGSECVYVCVCVCMYTQTHIHSYLLIYLNNIGEHTARGGGGDGSTSYQVYLDVCVEDRKIHPF